MSEGGAEVEGGDWAEQPRQISKRTRNARRTIINRNHLSMSKRLIISWQEGTLCGHSSCVRPASRPLAGSPSRKARERAHPRQYFAVPEHSQLVYHRYGTLFFLAEVRTE